MMFKTTGIDQMRVCPFRCCGDVMRLLFSLIIFNKDVNEEIDFDRYLYAVDWVYG